MKISKRQLRRIVREEKCRLEEVIQHSGPLRDRLNLYSGMTDALKEVIQRFWELGLTEEDMDEAWDAAKSNGD
jgi:hypothetical protein